MAGLLCLKWNNHSLAFLNLINDLHAKELYCDATIACHGKYYPVHRMVLSTCSEYFQEIFKLTQCKHPFIIVNDIKPAELEALLNYMYKGDVNVLQEMLPNLIKAAEALKVKGLAVPDELPAEKDSSSSRKRSSNTSSSSHTKRSKLSEKTHRSSESSGQELSDEIIPEPLVSAELPQNSNDSIQHLSREEDIKENVREAAEIPSEMNFTELLPQFPCAEEMPVTVKSEPYDPSYSQDVTKQERVEAFQLSETIDWSNSLSGSDANNQPPSTEFAAEPDAAERDPSMPFSKILSAMAISSSAPNDLGITHLRACSSSSSVSVFPSVERVFRCEQCPYMCKQKTHPHP